MCFPFHKEIKVQILSLDHPPPSSSLSQVKGFFITEQFAKVMTYCCLKVMLTKIFKLCVNIATTDLLTFMLYGNDSYR